MNGNQANNQDMQVAQLQHINVETQVQYGPTFNKMESCWKILNNWQLAHGLNRDWKFFVNPVHKEAISAWVTLSTLSNQEGGKMWYPGVTSSWSSITWLNNQPFSSISPLMGFVAGFNFENATAIDANKQVVIAFKYGIPPNNIAFSVPTIGKASDYWGQNGYSLEQRRVIIKGQSPSDLNAILPLSNVKGYFPTIFNSQEAAHVLISRRWQVVTDFRHAVKNNLDAELAMPDARLIAAVKKVIAAYTNLIASIGSIDAVTTIFRVSHDKRAEIRTEDQGTGDVNAFAHPTLQHSLKGVVNYLEMFALPLGVLANMQVDTTPIPENTVNTVLQRLRIVSKSTAVYNAMGQVQTSNFPVNSQLLSDMFVLSPNSVWLFDMPMYTPNDMYWLMLFEVLRTKRDARVMLKIKIPSAAIVEFAAALKEVGLVYCWFNCYISENKIFVSNCVGECANMAYTLTDLIKIKATINAVRNFCAVLAIPGDILNMSMSHYPGSNTAYHYVGYAFVQKLFGNRSLFKVTTAVAEVSSLIVPVLKPAKEMTDVLINWKQLTGETILFELCKIMSLSTDSIPKTAPWDDYAFDICEKYQWPFFETWADVLKFCGSHKPEVVMTEEDDGKYKKMKNDDGS